jgi:outer membrane protein TolC
VGSFDEFVSDRSYTVIEAVAQAVNNNLALRASQIDVSLAAENLAAAKTNYYPDLTVTGTGLKLDPDLARLSGGANPERTLSGAATLSQTLYSEESNAAIGSQRNLLRAQQQTYHAARLDTILNTTRASFNLLRSKNALQSQSENLEITQRNLRVAQQNYEAGQAGRGDILRFRSEMASNMQGVVDSLNAFQQAQHTLNAILNNPIDTRIEIKEVRLKGGPFEPEGFGYKELSRTLDDPAEQKIFQNFLIQEALEISPELAALQFNLAAVERDMAQYGWRRFIPTVSASAQYNRVFDRSGVGVPDPNLALDSDYNVGVVFSIPIFNRNSDNVALRRTERQKEQLELQIASQKQIIETNIRNAVLDVSGRIANIELSQVSETTALQSLELTEASYASGAATITDLIDSQNNYLQSQLASSNALYNFIDSALAMERAVGVYLFMGNSENNLEDFSQSYLNFKQQSLAEDKN